MKRVVIAGCRYYNDYEEAKSFIDHHLYELRKNYSIKILSGCSKGADTIGERYATENGFEVEKYPANWERYGRRAGPMRNKEMAENCHIIICFWDGKSKGTKSLIDYGRKHGKIVIIKRISRTV